MIPYNRYTRLQTVKARGPVLPPVFFIEDMVFDRRGKVFRASTSGGDLISKEWADDYLSFSNALHLLVSRLNGTVLLAASRRREALESLKGEPRKLSTRYAHLFKKYATGESEAAQEQIHDMELLMTSYEMAIAEAVNDGNVTLLRQMAENAADLDPFAPLIGDLAKIPDRGHKNTENRTKLLGIFTVQSHPKGGSWLKTGAEVIKKLEPLKDVYPDWVPGDILQLREWLKERDAEGIHGHLSRFYYLARKNGWKTP